MDVKDLLNPVPKHEEFRSSTSTPAPTPALTPTSLSSTTSLPRQSSRLHLKPVAASTSKVGKQKLAKDAPVFEKRQTKGEVLFPPYEAEDDQELLQELERYQVFPRGAIAEYCHRIPYSSDKRTFLSKTGRDAFEVFQYTFKIPGEDKEYVVMWDYNIGIVRITPFFKCCKHTKTTPAKALNTNSGLRDISYSITGGALAAQGYWMPFACAKALAATFCYNHRHAFTPLFGKDFLDICTHPDDDLFESWKIDKSIIERCKAEQASWLERPDAHITTGSSREPSEVPGTPNPIFKSAVRRLRALPRSSAASPESGFGTDSSWGEVTPKLSPSTAWAAINRPPGLAPSDEAAEKGAAESLLMLLASPHQNASIGRDLPRAVSHTAVLEKSPATKRTHGEAGSAEDDSSSSGSTSIEQLSLGECGKESRPADSHAAMALLELRGRESTTDAGNKRDRPIKRLRRSSVP